MTGTTGNGTTPTTTARRRLMIGLPIAAMGVVALAACGASTTTTGTGTTGTGTTGVDMQALRTCLSENGVTMPSRGAGGAGGADGGTPPSGGAAPTGAPSAGGPPAGAQGAGSGQAPPGVDAATWAKAQQACARYLPSGAAGATATNGA